MKYFILMIVFLGLSVSGWAEEPSADRSKNPLSELDAKIARDLKSEKWNDASKAFVHTMWLDYQKAYLTPTPPSYARSIAGKLPRVKSYDEYIGVYKHDKSQPIPFIEIVKDDAGRFHVKLGRHLIPAVLRGGMIIFTTGDVVYSSIPQLGDNPYCTLELFMILCDGDHFYCCSPRTTRDSWGPPLIKVEK